MNLDKLYKMQEDLDKYIWEKHGTLEKMSKKELLDSTILALLVEVGELANTTRCFKHWSTKGMMDKEIILEELADVWHFYLSIGNQLNWNISDRVPLNNEQYEHFTRNDTRIEDVFMALYHNISSLGIIVSPQYPNYVLAGQDIYILGRMLGFTDEEVEQAYLKKHKENYKRQAEGY